MTTNSRAAEIGAEGICKMFGSFTALDNISMTIGLMPVIGIPLPFVSYGGSSLIGFTLLTFTLVKLDSERGMYL